MINLDAIDALILKEHIGNQSTKRTKHFRGESAVLLRDYFFRLSDVLETELLIEVGAHAAETSVRFVKKENRIAIAFEANPVTFREKTKLASKYGVIVRNEGVSSKIGNADFHIPSGTSENLMPENASFRRKNNSDQATTILVNMTTIDKIIEELPASSKVGLWIDAEGFALEVLQGASKLLRSRKCQIVMVEVELKQFWVGQAQFNEVENLLLDSGFYRCMMDFESEFQRNLIFAKMENHFEIASLQFDFLSELLEIKSKYLSWRIKNLLVQLKLKGQSVLKGYFQI